MWKKTALIYILFVTSGLVLFAQNSRTLPFLEINADTRTAGMGDANMGDTKSMYIYTNPTAFFQNEGKIYTTHTYGIFPKIGDKHQSFHAISAGYRLFNKHALMAGFRYFGGLSIPRIGEDGIELKPIHPMDWAIDFSYAIQINDNLSAYVGGNFIQTYNAKTAYTGGFSTGAYYRNSMSLSGSDGAYSIGLALYDFGAKVQYGKANVKRDLPTSIGLGGSLSLPFSEDHKINAVLSTRYFLLPSEASEFTGGVGFEYEMYNFAAIRTGYHLGNSNNYLTIGVGFKVRFLNIDAAYMLTQSKDYNLLRLGFNVQF